METTVLLAALAIVSACVGSLVWVIKHLFTEILPVINNLVKVTERNTQATKSADIYLRERNGRDNHFHTEVMEALNAIKEQSKNQQVAEQTVEHQTVNNQTA